VRYSTLSRIRNYISKRLFALVHSSSFKRFGSKVSIVRPGIIEGEKYISIGDNTVIQKDCWLLAYKQDGISPVLDIEENVAVGRLVHIVSLRKVLIEENVLIADKVYISDNIHQYSDISTPIKDQDIYFKGDVVIGRNSWIGENVSIIGSIVGRHCVVGSNSVVTKDIMDYSVVAGVPAIYIKRFNVETNCWVKTNKDGGFIYEI
jgi:carbonic anhydrase/acetyltransferase-like protein (isoleucine patch superfamily)